MLNLNPNLKEVKMWASWWENPEYPPKIISIDKAVEEVRKGFAVVVGADRILLVKKKRPVRNLVFERDNYTCYFCGEYGDTLEHLLPRSKGGTSTLENCVCACKTCNNQKGNMTESEYWKWLTKQYIIKQKERKLLREIFS